MAKENQIGKIRNIFLSASVPKTGRDFFGTEDVIAIRDSVIALASAVLANPDYHLIWGGHPSVTPLITLVLDRYNLKMSDRVTLYQSAHFKDSFPPQNKDVGIRIITEDKGDIPSSVKLMREKMFGDNDFYAAVFIGGMNGILDEYKMIKDYHPAVRCFPIASTGAAARALYDEHPGEFDEQLLTELSYTSLFKELLGL
ncbi:MAG: hypothetical protein K6F58_07840 [Bacteroidales bacterium]|nr:hypothetical protein [Bacteroidales bacterium]